MDEDALRQCWAHPPEWVYGQVPIVPVVLERRIKFGEPKPAADGKPQFGFEYSFLVYCFRDGESATAAVHCLDEPGHVRTRVQDAAVHARRVLVFPNLRHGSIGLAPDNPSLLARVQVWRDHHLQRDPLGRT